MKSLKRVLCAVLITVLLISAIPVMAKDITMYNPNGSTETVSSDRVESYQKMGWYTYPVMYIYSVYNSFPIAKSDLAYWQKQGWYTYPVINVYSDDGTVFPVAKSDVEDWEKEGWHIDHKELLYAVDGSGNRKMEFVWKTQENQWKSAGWRTDEPKRKGVTRICDHCNGRNLGACSVCGGSGWHEGERCQMCYGTGIRRCLMCYGSGIKVVDFYYYD